MPNRNLNLFTTMPKIEYVPKKFVSWQEDLIDHVNNIVTTYKAQGYDLTLRQVYYQFISRDLLPERWADAATGSTNNQRAYKNLGELINSGRLAGVIDWHSIEDRTRELTRNSHWDGPEDIIQAAASSFAIDKWVGQDYRVEVWVEKDALEGVIAKPCKELDISYFSCRGYTSQTSMWDAAMRMKEYSEDGKKVLVLHLGDHDPSGKDMSRDIEDRIMLFTEHECDIEIRRIALNMNQIEQYSPPPNPAKITDSRAKAYIEEYGDESWELDALEPKVISQLITDHVLSVRDEDAWDEAVEEQREGRKLLDLTVDRWDDVVEFLNGLEG